MKRIVHTPELFLDRLEQEIRRCERYERIFSVLLFESPPGLVGTPEARRLEWAVTVVRQHTRISDVVALFPDQGLIALVLPETKVAGAQVVAERFIAPLDRLTLREEAPPRGWTFKTAAYPEDAGIIRLFLDRQLELRQPADAVTAPDAAARG